jgi:hypothetical protein
MTDPQFCMIMAMLTFLVANTQPRRAKVTYTVLCYLGAVWTLAGVFYFVVEHNL